MGIKSQVSASRIMAGTASVVSLVLLCSGCVSGYNSVMFATRSNAGVDLDIAPPVTEVGISRDEVVVAPTFEGGQTTPVLASFSSDQNFMKKFLFGVGSTYSTGESAFVMGRLYDSDSEELDIEEGCDAEYKPVLSQEPGLPWGMKFQKAGTVKPVTFGTGTILGVKVGWATGTAVVPSSIKIGFNRKEIAWMPVSLEECSGGNGGQRRYAANIPSLLATLKNETTAAEAGKTSVKYMQYFATGKAASEMSRKYGVRKAMLSRMDPQNDEAFTKRRDELMNLQVRLDMATEVGKSAVGRITTAALAQKGKEILDAYEYEDPTDCPDLPSIASGMTTLDTATKAGVTRSLNACLGSASNENEEVVTKFEAVVSKLNAAIP